MSATKRKKDSLVQFVGYIENKNKNKTQEQGRDFSQF